MSGPASILVVGAGPVGLVLACELRRGGVPVRLVDKLPAPSPRSKAVSVHARTLELLESMGVVDRFLGESVRTAGASLVAGGTTLADVDFAGVDTRYPFAACLPQDVTESILRDLLADLGGRIERGVELIDLAQDADGVRATLRHPDGGAETAGFSYAVGCDGGHSTVRHAVGVRLEGSSEGERFLLADCDAEHELARDRIYLWVAEHGLCALFPLHGRRVRLAAHVARSWDQSAEPALGEAQRIADERTGEALRLSNPRWLTYFEIHEAQVPQYRFGRVFLAGDAAHVHSPAGGQGMNTGMQDAANLAWKLRLAWSGAGAPGLLDSYQAERHPVGAHVVRTAGTMTAAMTREGALARHAREFLLSTLVGHTPLKESLARRLSETTISYRDSPIVGGMPRRTVGHGPLHPGDLAPAAPGVVEALDPLVHTVLHVGEPDPAARSAAELRASFGGLVRNVLVHPEGRRDGPFDGVVADADGSVAARYGAGEGLLAVVRPDRYLAYLGEPEDVEGAERVLVRAVA